MDNCSHVLGWGTSSSGIVKRVCFICQKTENNAYWHFKAIKEHIDPVFYLGVVV